jgi:hypothetical protein
MRERRAEGQLVIVLREPKMDVGSALVEQLGFGILTVKDLRGNKSGRASDLNS